MTIKKYSNFLLQALLISVFTPVVSFGGDISGKVVNTSNLNISAIQAEPQVSEINNAA
jgi:hypothetical protein